MNGNIKTSADTQIQIALGSLLETVVDKYEFVSDTISTSLRKIAKQHPNDVLKACSTFGRLKDVDLDHLGVVLLIMEDVCREHIVSIDGDTIMILIELCLDLMTDNVNHEPKVQMPASGVLVALGTKHCIQVVDGLMGKLSAGVVPHYTVPHTLGSLASANAFGVVPYIKNILGILLPLLAGLKQDVVKQSFAYVLGKFCEAILEYTTNPEQAPDPTISIVDFQTEMSMAYDVLFSIWLHAREVKLVETVLYALGAMFSILSEEKVRQHTSKCIQVLLAQYRKHKEAQAITKCLGSVIFISSRHDGTLLEPQVGVILQALSDLVCIAPDYAQPELLRTHSEVLRCYECLCTHYTDHTLDHILAQMKNNAEKDRIRGLVVLTHLTNTANGTIKNRLKNVLTALENMLNETNMRVKKTIMKAIVAIAYKGLLNNAEVSAEKFLKFIVSLCCKQHIYSPTDQQEITETKQVADNTLYMLSTSVKELECVLWDLLLKCLLAAEYSDACVVLLRCLTHLASRKVSGGQSSDAAFVRCLALLARPLDNFRGNFIINFLRNVKLLDSEPFNVIWESRLPHLLKYLEQNYDSFNVKEWEDLLFDFLTTLLEAANDIKFEESLVTCIKDQLPLYVNRPAELDGGLRNAEKSLVLKCLAIICCQLKSKEVIEQVLNVILQSVKPNDMNELQACAEAIGICSRSHLQIVFDKLYAIRKDILLKKSSKFFSFGFMKDQKGDAEIERVRYVILASYAEICNEAPADALLRVVQTEILDFVLHELHNCKEFTIRRVCLRAVGCVADALHPNRNKLHIQIQDRDKVLQLVSAQLQLHNGPEYIELFPVVIPVLTSLVRLPNVLESQNRLKLLKLCFDNVFNASAIYCKLGNSTHGDVKLAPHVFTSFSKVNLLVQELLVQSISPATLDEVFMLLEQWLGRKKLEQRLPALEALRTALQTYLDNMKFAYEGPSTFGQTGIILARVVPRCTDPNKNTRKVAVECVCLMLCISGRYEGHMRDNDKVLSNSLLHVQEQIDTEDPKLLFNLITELATIIGNNIPKYQLGHFVDTLLEGLLDVEASSSNGSSVVLNTVIKLKGADIQPFVGELLEKLLSTLDKITCSRTRSTALATVLSFANHHIKAVVGIILQQPLPYEQSTCSCWAILSTDNALTVEILYQLKKILKSCVFYEEQKNADKLRIATLKPLQAICALHELFKSKEIHELCKQQFSELFSLMFIALASYVDTAAPVYSSAEKKASAVPNRSAYKMTPFKICVDAFKLFLQNAESKRAAANLINCSDSLNSFMTLVPELTESVCSDYPQSLAYLVSCLGPYLRSDTDAQRTAVVAFFAFLLKHRLNNQAVLIENVLEMLLEVHNDPCCDVRKFSLRGLGHAAEFLNPDLTQMHSTEILNALMQGLDYSNTSESEVALESMLSFSKLIQVVSRNQLGQCHVTAAVRIKPLLQNEQALVREASILLFGDLASSLGPDDAFKEQIFGNIVAFLLHLSDIDDNVIKACKKTLRKLGPFLDCPKVNSMIQEHLLDDANLHFPQFCTDLIKAMSEALQEYFPQFIMTSLSFFKSSWVNIRANGALISGLLYAQTLPEFRSSVSLDALSYRLLQLLKDGEPEVRSRAAESLAYVFTT
ncbi:PREDICTED: maestro heat-like repeat-containing protein family member 1 [Nicrophorus vespilloides]|uniref:Maestro heat-like repeat-containing protein family member 1 n=1 Tax=Nicrophorus vespilloides TaxID=110193 RepID=A0ABM1NCB8_NICVS|nr:PREDICTED: maestro heat-like repeat-containing protein family member 1 [Nicrophorus vespilloides]